MPEIKLEAQRVNGTIPEWTVIEMQGKIEVVDGTSILNKTIGDLKFSATDDSATLIIGHHCLKGKHMQLKKPFAVIDQVCDAETGERKYIVRAIVKRRILFNNRPRPIVSCDL